MTQLINPPANIDNLELRTYLEQIHRVLRGITEGPNRAAFYQELLDAGLIGEDGSFAGEPDGEYDPMQDYQVPPLVGGLEVQGAFQNIILAWDPLTPATRFVSHAEIWRQKVTEGQPTANIELAEMVGTTPGAVYNDSVDPNTEFFYWVRWVSYVGLEGPFGNPVNAKTAISPEVLLDVLEGQITSTQLHADLNEAQEGLENQYTVKIGQNGEVAGFGLAFTRPEYDPNDPNHSLALFNVDTFAITHPGSEGLAFAVSDGKVVMDAGYIVNLTVNNAQIESLAADKLFAAEGNIAEAVIGQGDITNAMIGNVIQSNNYVPGQSGWRITKAGNAEFRNIFARGDILATDIVADTIETKHIKGGAVSAVESQSKFNMEIGPGQELFGVSLPTNIPPGETGTVTIIASWAGSALGRSTNMGVRFYGIRPGLPSINMHHEEVTVENGHTTAASTHHAWRNAPSGSSVHVYATNKWTEGTISGGRIKITVLTQLR